MKNFIISGTILLGLFIILPFLNVNYSFLYILIEWITKFVLPWIVLYWLIRAVKALEKKVENYIISEDSEFYETALEVYYDVKEKYEK